ncbi:GNAT family N-acetyltransferase [Natronolimnohabitans innermongolicus]|uniref:N-acetyltransferase GCN5 n=1 Tax=Natronolimnohabitans innermongolicus JCM 12255 TaxID=1227499 RepID=L9XJ78_9EURY|nr:GNAT family N-acetyltransferase [Natronolimnohabitans innermongolicus]ELY61647.1 N-acetyltransferase GCN5 [Natronolimnohabitans innermongolicus JCM 12255]
MGVTERPTFSSEASKQIYEYVERHGTVKRHRLLDVLSLPAEEFQTHLEALKANGYLQEDGGTLQIDFEFGAVTEYESGDLEFVIRPGRQNDFDGLIETIRDVTAEETYVVAETIAEELLYEDAVTRHNSVKSRMFFVATVDGEVVGWTHLDLPQIDQLQGTAQQTVGVREEYRSHGIGSKLLQRGIEWGEANGFRKVYNSIPITNDRALEFLTEHGWDTEAIRRDHYEIDGEGVDEVMMAREL